MATEEQQENEGATETETLENQREANQRLVLAALRAQLVADHAEAAQERAEEMARELRETAAFREQLIGIVGHDLRNPLTAIAMAAGQLLACGRLSAHDANLVQRILRSEERMARMITQILEFTRARLGGALPLELKPTNLHEICGPIMEELELATGTRLRCVLEGDLRGTWDPDRLAEVLSNLLGNAIDHATAGTQITVAARSSGDEIVVEVKNQGEPISPELLPHIFKAFRRAKTARRLKVGHLGLGLYVAHEVVTAHGGAIDACSSGGITTFTLRLPRVPPSECER